MTTAAGPSTETSFADAEINKKLSSEEKIDFLRLMHRIRQFEQISLNHYKDGKIGGFLHLYVGQESVAVGACSLMGKNDHVITAYRDHGHALAVGMGMDECMAELFGKATGCSKGKGGSMHFFAPDKNFWGGHGIVAGQTPLGAGIAYGLKYKGLTGCCMTFMGDGAVNQGCYHEALNLAELWDLPVIYIIENNGYSMGTSQMRSSAFDGSLAQRAAGYGIEWDVANGENLYEVRAKTQIAIDRAHKESRPTILEIDTYRHYGHSIADANADKYRTPEEIQRYKEMHDPLLVWKNQLVSEGLIEEADSKQMQKDARNEAKAAVKFADESPFPETSAIFEDVYANIGENGKHFFNE